MASWFAQATQERYGKKSGCESTKSAKDKELLKF